MTDIHGRDEDPTYAMGLGRCGVEVEFGLWPGVPHVVPRSRY
jgi:hypothetical protein